MTFKEIESKSFALYNLNWLNNKDLYNLIYNEISGKYKKYYFSS